MAGNYPHMPGVPPYYPMGNVQPVQQQPGPYMSQLPHLHPISTEHLPRGIPDFDDAGNPIQPSPASARARRQTTTGSDQVKHRRTRSGCFTCRNRRVKCDETHPICERCRKGKRECQYPEPSTSAKSSARSGTKQKQEIDESDSSDDDEGKEPLSAILDEDEPFSAEPLSAGPGLISSQSFSNRDTSNTPGLTNDKSPSPSTESSYSIRPTVSRSMSRPNLQKAAGGQSWSNLPGNISFLLNFHRTHLSCHHYGLKIDSADFLKTTFLDIAIHNEPLLYAVVGFAAYYHTVSQKQGKLEDFLQYYHKSVQLLRVSLQRNQRANVPTLLCILQLANIEELLGDWVNLMGHLKAAHKIMTTLFTPQTITQNETTRKILQWIIRFDLFIGFQSGSQTILAREWFLHCHEYYIQQARDRPNEVIPKIEERFMAIRVLATDAATLHGRKSKSLISDEVYGAEIGNLKKRFAQFYHELEPILTDSHDLVTDFTGWPERHPDDIVNAYEPGIIHIGNLYGLNFLLIDIYAVELIFDYPLMIHRGLPPSQDQMSRVYKICQMFQALEAHPQKPPAAVLDAHAGLAIAVLYLPKDQQTIAWCKRRYLSIESLGYIYSPSLRQKMSSHWGEADFKDGWTANNTDTPVLRTIRMFIHERQAEPKDENAEALRDLRGLFKDLDINRGSSTEASPSSNSEMEYRNNFSNSMASMAEQDPSGVYVTGSSPIDTSAWQDAYQHQPQ